MDHPARIGLKHHDFHRVYVWEIPVRVTHWVNAGCILILTVTGILIAHPPALASAAEASDSYWFGVNRFIHFVAGYVFLCSLLLRLYWGLVGNQYGRLKNFIPVNRRQFKQVGDVLKVDILQSRDQPISALGHNQLAYFSYLIVFLVFAFQIVSGFGLYAAMSDSAFAQLFNWVVPLFGSDYALRHWHYMAMWFLIIFTLIHVYLVFYHDYVEGEGVMSSMVGGWKFLPGEEVREKLGKKKRETTKTAEDAEG